MAARNRDRVVHFYEIADADAPTSSRLPHRDWGAYVRRLCTQPPSQRTVRTGDEILIGTVDPLQTAPHLLLAKVRPDVPQLIDDDGTLSRLQLAADKELVDVTTVFFLPFGNVVATMAGGISAPRAQALKRWLDEMHAATPDVRNIELRPVVNARSRDKLAHAAAVEKLTVRVAPEPPDSPSALRASSDLGSALSRLHEDNPDMVITLTLEVPKKSRTVSPRRRARGHRQLLDSTRVFAGDIEDWLDNSDAVDTAAARARMEAWHSEADDEKIDFVSERITAKCVVPFSSSDGHAIDLQVALNELERVSQENERVLRAAVSADL